MSSFCVYSTTPIKRKVHLRYIDSRLKLMKLSLNMKIFFDSEKKLNRIDLTNSNLKNCENPTPSWSRRCFFFRVWDNNEIWSLFLNVIWKWIRQRGRVNIWAESPYTKITLANPFRIYKQTTFSAQNVEQTRCMHLDLKS